MGTQSDQKKVSISSANPEVISNLLPVSEPSGTLYLAVISSLLGAIGLGLAVGYFSPVIDVIKADTPENKESRSWMASITPLGALFGGLLAPVMVRYLGKRKALISHGIPFTIGWICFLIDGEPSHTFFIIGRALAGLSCGLSSGTAPGYVSEIATVNKRGFLGSCFQLFITFGILFASIVGNLLKQNLNLDGMYYKPFAIFCAIPPILMSIGMVFMPESPIQIISQGPLNDRTIDQARKELIRLRSSNSSIDSELNQIIESQKALNEMGDEKLSQKISKIDFYRPLSYALLLMFAQQLSGINAILFFTNTIFESASSKDHPIDLTLANTVFTVMQSLATLLEMFIVERLGRRIMMISSGCGCALGLGVMATFAYIKQKDAVFGEAYSWIPLVALVFYIISFSLGLAPVPWLMVPELTPANNRAFISGVATACSWSIAFFVVKFFEPLQILINDYGVYFVFMTLTIIMIVSLIFFLPETGGKNMDEICREYANGWRNSLFVGTSGKRNSIRLEANRQDTAQSPEQHGQATESV